MSAGKASGWDDVCLLEKDANASTHSRLPFSLDLYRSKEAGSKFDVGVSAYRGQKEGFKR